MKTSISALLPLACAGLCFGQISSKPAPNIALEASIPNLPAQIIGPDDMIMLSVYDSPEFTRTVRVGPDGTIRLPMLKQRVKAEGLLPSQLESAIADALQQEKLLVDPFVTVNVMEYHSRPVNVIGAVKQPTTFQVIGTVTLLDAITRAGGLRDDAEGEILLSRLGSDKKTALTQRIPAKALIESADSEYNVKLQGGEEIRVPEAPRVTIAGNVKKPGQIPVKEATELTVMKAIAMAEGLAPYSQNIAYIYRPDDEKGTKNEISIPLKAILQRKAPDVPLMARDILYIPDSSGKKNLEKVLGLGATTLSGMLIWRMP